MPENKPEMNNPKLEESSEVTQQKQELTQQIEAIKDKLTEEPDTNVDPRIADTKQLRQDLDKTLSYLKTVSSPVRDQTNKQPNTRSSRERSLAVTKIQEAIMWLGMDLKAMKEEGVGELKDPYPSSYDPKSGTIEPTADGLKL